MGSSLIPCGTASPPPPHWSWGAPALRQTGHVPSVASRGSEAGGEGGRPRSRQVAFMMLLAHFIMTLGMAASLGGKGEALRPCADGMLCVAQQERRGEGGKWAKGAL